MQQLYFIRYAYFNPSNNKIIINSTILVMVGLSSIQEIKTAITILIPTGTPADIDIINITNISEPPTP